MVALTGEECRDLWTHFINANYLPKVGTRGSSNCLDCGSNRECNNYYYLACKEGGLCPIKFKTNQPHGHHPWLQVRRVTSENVVNVVEVVTFLGSNASKIQKFIGNSENIFKLRMPNKEIAKKSKFGDKQIELICRGCNLSISRTTNSKVGVEVCTIECLIIYIEKKHQLEWLKLKEAVDLQRRDYMQPLTMEEKIQFRQQKKKKSSTLVSASKSKPNAPILELGALALEYGKNLVDVSKVEDEDNKKTQQGRKNISLAIPILGSGSGSQAHIYDYSTFPIGYKCENFELLCEVCEVEKELGGRGSQDHVYSTFPIGYKYEDLDLLCEVCEVEEELGPKLKKRKTMATIS